MLTELDNPDRIHEIKSTIERKPALQAFYLQMYERYTKCLEQCPRHGKVLELGSGGGFAKDVIPSLITSDVLPYKDVDQVVDALNMPFPDNSLRAIFMLNTFHHIPDVEKFLFEAQRCLLPGGRLLIVDQHMGVFSYPVLKYAHHEPFLPKASSWKFATTGPLSGANGALTWIVFKRDRQKFDQLYTNLKVIRYEPHTPLLYFLSGGLKKWNLAPKSLLGAIRLFEKSLVKLWSRFGSQVDVEIVKTN